MGGVSLPPPSISQVMTVLSRTTKTGTVKSKYFYQIIESINYSYHFKIYRSLCNEDTGE